MDSAFDKLSKAPGSPNAPPALAIDPAAAERNRELFREMACEHARPVRDFMLELVVGPTTRRWFDIVRPILQNMLRAAESVEERALADQLGAFDKVLERAGRASGTKTSGAERDALLVEYAELARILPPAFDLEPTRKQREPVVLRNLLHQVPGFCEDNFDSLSGAGLISLGALYRCSIDELISRGCFDPERAEAIVTRLQTYWKERTEHPLEKAQPKTKQKLQDLTDKLHRAHEEFQRAEASEDRERKRRARNERRSRALELNVLLAQLGEVDLVAELEHSPTEQKVQRVRSYIEQSARMTVSDRQEVS